MSIHFLRSGVSGKAILTVFGLLAVVAIAESHSAFTLFWGIVIAAGLIAAYNSSRSTAALVASFISIQLLLNAFYDLKTLFILSGTGVHTDALNMQHATGVPAVVWAVMWIAISVYTTYRVLFK